MVIARAARAAALVLVVVLAVAGCSGGPGGGPTNDPAGSVTNALAAVSSGGLAKVTDFACAAHKNDLANAFGGGNADALAAAGVKPEDIYNAMAMSFTNVTTKEVSKTDTAATVHVTADMKITIDKDKFKTLMKTMLSAQGQPADDATVDAIMGGMTSALEQSQKFDQDVQVVNEGGKWLLCE
jgi:hypothetical protein